MTVGRVGRMLRIRLQVVWSILQQACGQGFTLAASSVAYIAFLGEKNANGTYVGCCPLLWCH